MSSRKVSIVNLLYYLEFIRSFVNWLIIVNRDISLL